MAMITVAPAIAVTALIWWNQGRWGTDLNLPAILVGSLFGLITVPLWPTYIPALVLTPILMNRIANHRSFFTLRLVLFLAIAFSFGAVAGVVVLGYPVILALGDSVELATNWAFAGAVSGGVTSTLICMIYRYVPRNGYQSSAANAAQSRRR